MAALSPWADLCFFDDDINVGYSELLSAEEFACPKTIIIKNQGFSRMCVDNLVIVLTDIATQTS